eukprot:scaffold92200_cov60-Phaeocystis_antarctica.AAC.1
MPCAWHAATNWPRRLWSSPDRRISSASATSGAGAGAAAGGGRGTAPPSACAHSRPSPVACEPVGVCDAHSVGLPGASSGRAGCRAGCAGAGIGSEAVGGASRRRGALGGAARGTMGTGFFFFFLTIAHASGWLEGQPSQRPPSSTLLSRALGNASSPGNCPSKRPALPPLEQERSLGKRLEQEGRMPIRGKLEDTALGGAGDQRRQGSGPPSTQHLRGHTNETPRVSLTNVTAPPSPHPPRVHTVETRAAAEDAHADTSGEGPTVVGRRLYASTHREDAAMVGPAGGTAAAAAAASASHATSSGLPGALTARGPGAGETRAATSDLLGMTTRAGGAALTLLLVVLLLRMVCHTGLEPRTSRHGPRQATLATHTFEPRLGQAARMPWAEALTSEEERRKADGSRHRQAGMRVLVRRACACWLGGHARAG